MGRSYSLAIAFFALIGSASAARVQVGSHAISSSQKTEKSKSQLDAAPWWGGGGAGSASNQTGPPKPNVPGAYLLFDSGNRGTMWLKYSKEPIEHALAFFEPSPAKVAPDSFKYKSGGQKVQLMTSMGVDHKKYYNAWVAFVREGYKQEGTLTVFYGAPGEGESSCQFTCGQTDVVFDSVAFQIGHGPKVSYQPSHRECLSQCTVVEHVAFHVIHSNSCEAAQHGSVKVSKAAENEDIKLCCVPIPCPEASSSSGADSSLGGLPTKVLLLEGGHEEGGHVIHAMPGVPVSLTAMTAVAAIHPSNTAFDVHTMSLALFLRTGQAKGGADRL